MEIIQLLVTMFWKGMGVASAGSAYLQSRH